MTPYYLTTPIYYVNAKPHLGHAYTTIVADAMTRFAALMGREAMFITGTDEHGDKIVKAAEQAGCPVWELTDRVSGEFRALWPELQVYPAHFVRTTSEEHKAVVRAFLQKIYDAGDIYFGGYGGYYCYGCERFYTEKELENGVCPQHLTPAEYISEKNYFFRMSAYQERLKKHIRDNPDFIRPARYRAEALALLDGEVLDDLCISRPKARLSWGIELPFDSNYVCYVWFDALLAYVTALGGPGSSAFNKFWPHAEHLVAKDILKPHAVFWPTMLMAAGLPLYRHLNVHGYWLSRAAKTSKTIGNDVSPLDTAVKMSKTIGNVVSPLDTAVLYGLDGFRYFLLREMQFGSDADFSEEALISRFNADLANDLGNLFSRVLVMAEKFCAGRVPVPGPDKDREREIKILALDSLADFQNLFGQAQFSFALERLWDLVRALNRYVDKAAPWALARTGDSETLGTVLYTLLECMRKTALHLWPVMPDASARMLAQLGCACPVLEGVDFSGIRGILPVEAESFGTLEAGTGLAGTSNLFPRIDVKA